MHLKHCPRLPCRLLARWRTLRCRQRFEREYAVLGELGRGAFGSALRVQRRRDGSVVCLKVLDTQNMSAAERRMVRAEAGREGNLSVHR